MSKMKRITIIGMGFLMEYIFPCVRAMLGENTAQQVNAVTADAGDQLGKQQRMGIPVLLNDNMRALQEMEPDWIFFAPPPMVVPKLVEECLKPYYAQRRAEGKALPVLFAFPPKPAGAWYQQQLGEDLAVVNIIPNMISMVGSEPVPAESCHLITYPERDNFTPAMKQELEALLSPMGRPLTVTPDKILPVLSAEIGVHPLTELAEVAARAMTDTGNPTDYRAAASAMRYWHQQQRGFRSRYSNEVQQDAVQDCEARAKMCALLDCWYHALTRFLAEAGVSAQSAASLLDALFDLYLHEAQLETREEIVAKARKDATKGGMLELCLECYHEEIEPLPYEVMAAPGPVQAEQLERLDRLIRLSAADVVKRGSGLAGGAAVEFIPTQHAVLFGLLARHTLENFGEAAPQVLERGVKRYGRERGARMAKRAAARGVQPDTVAYLAFSEWRYPYRFEKSVESKEPVYITLVHQCPWCWAWKEYGLQEYGPWYCRYVDEALVKGFNEELSLKVHSNLSEGAPCCRFEWQSLAMTAENAGRLQELGSRLGDSCLKDWEYHTAHLLSAMGQELLAQDEALGRRTLWQAMADFRQEFGRDAARLVESQAKQDFSVV